MVELRHVGLYVNNMEDEIKFYSRALNMHILCENTTQRDSLTDDILCASFKDEGIIITKLLTDKGLITGHGDMLELVKIISSKGTGKNNNNNFALTDRGIIHLAFLVDDITLTVAKIIRYGGAQYSNIHSLQNGNKCCFCCDPEGNYIELIQHFSD